MDNTNELSNLGWQAFFQQQLTLDEWDAATPARIVEQHRSEITVAMGERVLSISLHASMPDMVVGDWLLLDAGDKFIRLLDRKTCFSRKAAGSQLKRQLISANVDTAFIVMSMNDDFNLNRLERFLSLVNESGAESVVVLSKSDQIASAEDYLNQVKSIDPFLAVEFINSLDNSSVSKLQPWIRVGSTIAMLGSSGVGKSTLTNTLLNAHAQATAGIREDDSKGRHTTTSRSLVAIKEGGLILDTPGMREIQLTDCKEGIASTFADIQQLAQQCQFGDCRHVSEPGCAVNLAVEAGELDQRRLHNYQKLLREEQFNSASLSERRASDKALGQFYKTTLKQATKLKGR